MRQLQILVADEQQTAVADLLDAEEIDYLRQEAWTDGTKEWLFSAPVPGDAIGYILTELDEAGVDERQYTMISSLESATTPHSEALQSRFASGFNPLTQPELEAKARDMSQDPTSFLSMIFLSAVIAAAGLLIGSPAIVVGSMVIAPIVGPVLTATVAGVVGDRQMLLDSLWLQGVGLVVAVAGATLFAAAVVAGGFSLQTLDLTSLDLVGVRLSPSLLSVAVGLAAGAAGAFGLTTKGPTSLIGVMIAAALIPTAATAGLAVVWNEPRVVVGSLLLLAATMILINLGAFIVLLALGYRPQQSGWLLEKAPRPRKIAVVATAVVLLLIVGSVGAATAQQLGFERSVNGEIDGLTAALADDDLEAVAVSAEYSGQIPLVDTEPERVTVLLAHTDGEPPDIAADLEARITEATGEEVTVRTEFIEYSESDRQLAPW